MTKKLMKPPKNEKKTAQNMRNDPKWAKSQKMAYFLNPSVKNFDFLIKSFIYIFLICFGTFFPVAKNLGQKWFGGGVLITPGPIVSVK